MSTANQSLVVESQRTAWQQYEASRVQAQEMTEDEKKAVIKKALPEVFSAIAETASPVINDILEKHGIQNMSVVVGSASITISLG